MGSGEIALIIVLSIIVILVTSVIGGLILWGLARGLGKIENATFLNSWGLYWILSIAQTFIGLIFYGIFIVIAFNINYNDIIAIGIVAYIFYYIISIFTALGITKGFWKCTFGQATMTHLIPMILYFLLSVIQIIVLASSNSYYY
tara:strand:- start:192 stop:626 length:435 start_codon:yes stop_codon:yes gene_type:complete